MTRLWVVFYFLFLTASPFVFAQDDQSIEQPAEQPTEPIADSSSDHPLTAGSEPTPSLSESDELPSPTAHYEEYETERFKRLNRINDPTWSANFTYEHHAFPTTDFKKPTNPIGLQPGKLPSSVNPIFRGFLLSGERMLTKKAGILSFGIEGGLYAAKEEDGYSKLPIGLIPAAAYLQYQFRYIDKQWIVPTVKAEYEAIMQNYQYEGNSNKGLNQLTRVDAGALIFLNFMDPWSAGEMNASYGVKRTYLTATFSYSKDLTKKTFDLSEKNWRVGFRFEY